MKSPFLSPGKLIALCLLPLWVFPSLVEAQIVADFAGGNSADEIDAYVGKAGLGWTNAWGLRRSHPVGVVSEGGTVWGNQSRLQITPRLDATGNAAVEVNVHRNFGSFSDSGSGQSLDIAKPFSISFSLSINDLRDFLATPTNTLFLGQSSGDSPNSTASSIWWITGFGGTETTASAGPSGALQGQWNLYSGKRGSGTYVPTGILLEENVLYRFVINLDPENESYTVSISNGTNISAPSGPLTFSYTTAGTTLASSNKLSFAQTFQAAIFESGELMKNNESAVYSIGDISIAQIPEPSTAFLILTLVGAGLVGRQWSRRQDIGTRFFLSKTVTRSLFLSLASAFFAGLNPAVHAVTLVTDGRPDATIIIPEDALPLTRSAAGELASVLGKISGATVNVTENPASVETGNRIWVGVRPEVLSLLSPEEQQFEYPEEILIKATEKDLILIGRDTFRGGRQVEAGTRIAVTTYLQDHLGVRWLWPGELGTEVPEKKTVRTDPVVYRYHPQLRWRELRGVNHLRALEMMKEVGPVAGVDNMEGLLRKKDDEVREWLHHHKADHATAGGVPSPLRGSLTFNAGHAYSNWWERFHRKHPEWFALQPDGTRGPFPSARDVKINPSNPEVAAQWLKDAKAFFTENPDRLFRSAAENDRGWQGYCTCETCLSWDSPEAPWLENTLSWATKKGVRSRALTDRYVKYWNILARGLKEMFPDRNLYVGVMAYNPMRPAPVRETLEPNIAVAFEGIHVRNPIDNSREKEAIGRRMWQDWASKAEMMIWRPNLIHQTAGLPYVFPRRHSENMKFLADNKMVGISVDSIGNHWATQGPSYYVVAQLAWNPYLDVEVLLKDYYQSAFGPAAPYVARYFDLFEKLYGDLAEAYGEAGWHRNRDLPKLYRERLVGERPDKTKRLGEEEVDRNFDLEEAAAQLLEQAKQAVAQAPVRYQQRVAFIAKGLEFTRLQLDSVQAMNDLRDGRGRRDDLLMKAEIAGERRREFLEENIHDQAIGYYELLGRQLLGGASEFGPPSVAKLVLEAESQAKALDDEKGEAEPASSEESPVMEESIR